MHYEYINSGVCHIHCTYRRSTNIYINALQVTNQYLYLQRSSLKLLLKLFSLNLKKNNNKKVSLVCIHLKIKTGFKVMPGKECSLEINSLPE